MGFDIDAELVRLRFDLRTFLESSSRRESLLDDSTRVLSDYRRRDSYDVARAFEDLSFYRSSETAFRVLEGADVSHTDIVIPALLDACAVMIGFHHTPPPPKMWRPNLIAERLAAITLRCEAFHLFSIAKVLSARAEELGDRGTMGFQSSQLMTFACLLATPDEPLSGKSGLLDRWKRTMETLTQGRDVRSALHWLGEHHVSLIGTSRNRDDHEFGSQVFRVFPVAALAFVAARRKLMLDLEESWRSAHPVLASPLAFDCDGTSVRLPRSYRHVLSDLLGADATSMEFINLVAERTVGES